MNTAGDEERLRSWIFEVVQALVEDARWRTEGDERRLLGHAGLTINMRTGAWYAHGSGCGGWSVIPLIGLLKACSRAEAVEWAQAWLLSHPGTGTLTSDDDGDVAAIENAAIAREIIGRLVDPAGTPAELYLRRRGIESDLPECVSCLPDARTGESAVAGVLVARGRVVGAQVGYLTPGGEKSLVAPARRRFMAEKAPDAVFEIQPAPAGITDLLADTFVTEGLEDALALAELGRAVRIVGLPGIGTLRHLPVKRGERIVLIRDGDDPGTAADKALIAGVDHLLLQGASVQITATPAGQDANSVLQAGGTTALAELVADTYPAELSIEGEFIRLSQLDRLDYEKERKVAADRLGIRVSVLDAEVGQRRAAGATKPAAAADTDVDEIELLDAPVNLAETLDEILTELQRYIVTDEQNLAAVVLWCAHAHLLHHEHIRLQRSPRLAVQARTPGAGKTTLLEAIGALVPRARVAASLTASTVLRVVDQLQPALLIDEADRVLHDQNSDLLSILNAGDRRATAWVERSIPTSDGGWEVKRFSVWGAVAFAGIDELPPTLQDRSIVIQLQKALDRDIPDHLEDGTSGELQLLKRKLATWSHDLEEFPRPILPDILTRQAGRTGDNWRVLFGVAQLAAGRWPGLIEQAALEAVRREARLTVVQRLLESVYRIFENRAADRAIKADDKTRITTPDLIAALLSDDQDEWNNANRGRAVTWYWLRDNLRHLLDPPGTKEWEGPASGGQRGKRYRGYLKAQFERAWERHLPSSFSTDASQASTVSAGSTGDEQNQGDNEKAASAGENSSAGTADGTATADAETYRTSMNGKNPSNSATSADTADTADGLDGFRKKGSHASNGADLSGLDLEIVAFGVANPKWATARIAKRFGQPRDVVARLLGRDR